MIVKSLTRAGRLISDRVQCNLREISIWGYVVFFSLFSIVLRRFTTPFNIDDKRTNKERSVSSSSSSQDSGDVVSTSEDAVYSEKFDLTNNSLRDHYAKLNTSSEKPIVEVETVTNKDSSKMTTTGLRKDGKVSRSVSGTTTCDVDLEAVEGNNGPTFKDFDECEATNRLEALDAALRRNGRFDCEIALGVPDVDARAQILSVVVQRLRLETWWTKVIHVAIEEKFISIESSEGDGVIDCTIKVTHFQQAVSLVSPSVSKQQIKHYERLREMLQRRG
ncbi:hypothetical protein IGI04_012445 [Brassica rapa subsp. trilocularis]|uniref:Plus3 domain-containing protein n=1 Tax=Brassica rapa subsp. trilocularis TaxID=1813537 RepID=A0ABQ7N816_BRACM|nr:hypothetical protein IGI04_012445 [Brassica rapa subsp. trilocularis]